MFSTRTATFAALLALAVASLSSAAPTPITPTNMWKGSVDDEKLQKLMPENGVITNAKDWEALCKAWKVADKVPEVNFEKELIVIATNVGSGLNLRASLDEKGDLKALGLGTRDIRPGFRYVILSVSREGVKTVNG